MKEHNVLKTLKLNDVVTLKLVSGEEIIGYFVDDSSGGIILRKPVVPVATGQGSMGLAPFIMSSDYLSGGDPEISFNKNTVIAMVGTHQQFRDAYTKQVSGIDLNGGKKTGLII